MPYTDTETSDSQTADGITTTTTTYLRTTCTVNVDTILLGPLVVSANPRYFQNGLGQPVFLTGSHTWENRQDQSPNGAFVWATYLDNLVTWGHNFIKLWVWEQPKPPNGLGGAGIVNTTDTITPEIWERTGPGNAADGGLKFDLTQYNADFFDRTRAPRCRLTAAARKPAWRKCA